MRPVVKPVTCKTAADKHGKNVQKKDLTGVEITHTHTPDAGHASSLRAKLASLQLTGNNLSFSFQLPGQTFKLQLLQREGENVSQHVSIYLLSHLQSS